MLQSQLPSSPNDFPELILISCSLYMSSQINCGYSVSIWNTAISKNRKERYGEPPHLRNDTAQFSSHVIGQSKSYVSSRVLSGMYSPSTEREQQSAKFESDVNGIGKYNPPLEIIQDIMQSIVLHRLFI